jgi:hypothetical protein
MEEGAEVPVDGEGGSGDHGRARVARFLYKGVEVRLHEVIGGEQDRGCATFHLLARTEREPV